MGLRARAHGAIGAALVLLLSNVVGGNAREYNPLDALHAQAPGAAPSGAINFRGFVRVIDGDTIEINLNGRRVGIGILGIDAPQGNTPCGRQATSLLEQLVADGLTLDDDPDSTLRYDDRLRRMYHAVSLGGKSIDQELVGAGVARSTGRGAKSSELAAVEAVAKGGRAGCVWSPTSTGGKSSTLIGDASAMQLGPTQAPALTTVPTGFAQDVVAVGLSNPTGFSLLAGGGILVAEKPGIVRVWRDGVLLSTPFIDIRDRVNDYWDHGLLGIAIDPNFATNGFLYLAYTYENNPLDYDGTKTGRLARYTAVGDTASPTTESVVLGTIVGATCTAFPVGSDCIPADGPSHGLGAIRFAADGTMFVASGEGANFNVVNDLALRAQDLDSLGGKILRVTPAGAGLATNPFWNGSEGANRSKVWAYGVRNAFRFGVDPTSGVPYIGDVGWDLREEINAAVPGANLGWPCYEGSARQPGYEPKAACQSLYALGPSAVRAPVFEYDHCQLFCGSSSVIGGFFYTASAFPTQYQGVYFYADYGQGFIRYLRADASHQLVPGSVATLATSADGPVDLAPGSDGSLYYLSINTGEVRRIRFVPTSGSTYLSDLTWTTMTNGWGPAEKDKSNGEQALGDGRTLTLNTQTYAKGLGVHAASDIRYAIP
ncbi:MAG: PQQ-dependent sugar dehydrogenase, partial [Gaiellales bacterium]